MNNLTRLSILSLAALGARPGISSLPGISFPSVDPEKAARRKKQAMNHMQGAWKGDGVAPDPSRKMGSKCPESKEPA